MLSSFEFYALAVPAVIFAGISKGGFGSGASFAAAPLLALVLDPLAAVAVMLPVLMVIDATTMGPYWQKWRLREARLMVFGAVGGCALGMALIAVIHADVVRFLIGSVALGFVAFQLARERGILRIARRPASSLPGMAWGGVAGFTSFISHAGGPPASIYLLRLGLTKLEYQATTVLVFTAINVMKFGAYGAMGLFTREAAWLSLWLAPFGALGALMGVVAHRMIPERLFFRITYVLLAITGTKLIFDAVT